MNLVLPIKQRLAQPDNVAVVRKLLNAQPAPTRTQLAKELCRRLDLRDPKGDWQVATTAQALRDLEAQGHWTLPTPKEERKIKLSKLVFRTNCIIPLTMEGGWRYIDLG